MQRKQAMALVLAAGYIAAALALKLAEKAGYLPHGAAVRALQALTGVSLAVYANFLPKRIQAIREPMMAMRMQSVLRVSGWAFMLGGLGYAAASLLPFADAIGLAVLSAATAYVLGYTGWAYVECSIARRRAA